MSVKNDAKRRWVELEFLLPGTPEEVWRAIATGPGMSCWFTPTSVDERLGGSIVFDFGDGSTSQGVITEWQPPARLRYEEHGWNGEAPAVATEVVVTARAGGKCVVRLVHSLFTTLDSWDDELEGFEAGWPGFFELLRVYLQHFAGQSASPVRNMVVCDGAEAEAWQRLTTGLGLAGANVGDRRSTPPSAPALAGVVERVRQDDTTQELLLRLEAPGPGLGLVGAYRSAGKLRVAASIFFYGEGAPRAAAKLEPELTRWLSAQFSTPTS